MDKGAWWVTVHGIARVGNNLVTKPSMTNDIETDVSKKLIKISMTYMIIYRYLSITENTDARPLPQHA